MKTTCFTTKQNSSAPGLQRRASHHLTKCYPTWGRRPNQGGGPVVWHSSPYVVIYVLVIYCAMWGRWVYSHALSHRHVVIRPPPQPNTTNTRTNWGEGIQTHGPGNRSSVIQDRRLQITPPSLATNQVLGYIGSGSLAGIRAIGYLSRPMIHIRYAWPESWSIRDFKCMDFHLFF